MTYKSDIYTALQAYCLLSTREPVAGVTLPESLSPRPHLLIFDVQRFTTTNLLRLESDSRVVADLAAGNLLALINNLKKS